MLRESVNASLREVEEERQRAYEAQSLHAAAIAELSAERERWRSREAELFEAKKQLLQEKKAAKALKGKIPLLWRCIFNFVQDSFASSSSESDSLKQSLTSVQETCATVCIKVCEVIYFLASSAGCCSVCSHCRIGI